MQHGHVEVEAILVFQSIEATDCSPTGCFSCGVGDGVHVGDVESGALNGDESSC